MMMNPTAEELMPRTKRGVQIYWRAALIPLSLAVLATLRFVFHAPMWVLIVGCLWIPAYYLIYPVVLNQRWHAFDREFTVQFQRGEYKQLLAYYKSQWFLRRFGPRAEMMGKLGLIYAAMQRFRDAEQVLEGAVETAGPGTRDRLYFNLANVKFELGKHDAAEQIYRSMKPGSPYRHAAQAHLALIDMGRGERVDEARVVLKQERKRASGTLRERIDEALAAAQA
jgi:tetratricopeptide (TPR) repeat protein